MRKKSIHITVPTPCHESWSAMSATERGAFCNSCQKEVIDFTVMTDQQLIAHLSQNTLSCGKFRRDQVGRGIISSQTDNGFMRWRALALGLLPLLTPVVAKAVMPVSTISDQSPIASRENKKDTPLGATGGMLICGRAVDVDRGGLANASIEVHRHDDSFTGNGAVSDSLGYFEIRLTAADFTDGKPYLKVSSDRYTSHKYLSHSTVQNVLIEFPVHEEITGGGIASIEVIRYEWKRFSNPFKKMRTEHGKKASTPAGNMCVYGTIRALSNIASYASVRVVDSTGVFYGNGAVSDAAGEYTVYIDKTEHALRNYHLEISSEGFPPRHVSLDSSDIQERSTRLFKNSNNVFKHITQAKFLALWLKYKFKYAFKKKGH